MTTQTLEDLLRRRTIEGILYKKIPDKENLIQCFACAHRCKIREGTSGICKVRYNENNILKVPFGYLGAWQCDPIEKKPFYHAYPNSLAMSFGMLGCDLHCSYCFTPDTHIITNIGPKTLVELFDSGEQCIHKPDADIAFKENLRAITSSGKYKDVKGIFKHYYSGDLINIFTYYLPELKCTPNHKIYATNRIDCEPVPIEASKLTNDYFLAIPKTYVFSHQQFIQLEDILHNHKDSPEPMWNVRLNKTNFMYEQITITNMNTNTDKSNLSKDISQILIKRISDIEPAKIDSNRRVKECKLTRDVPIENNTIRFSHGHEQYVPLKIPFDESIARLLGLYCAKGSIIKDISCVDGFWIDLSFSHQEIHLVKEVQGLFQQCLKADSSVVERESTLEVYVYKTNVALLFKSLIEEYSSEKRVPYLLYDAHKSIVKAFLTGLIDGNGHKDENGQLFISTQSLKFAYQIAWLVLKSGYLPSITSSEITEHKENKGIQKDQVKYLYNVVWYENTASKRELKETETFYLIPITEIIQTKYDGYVYNLEVDDEHNYLAGLYLVSNCQNWITSQTLRNPDAGVQPRDVTPKRFIAEAKRYGARVVTSTYNEPLITSEWSMEIFKEAKKVGLATSYVSNGNGTPEALDFIRPYTDLYKIDLKSFQDKNYRQLGTKLDSVLETIKGVYQRGFWLEIVTLLIPGFNDSNEELQQMAEFLVDISPNIPWHVTAFHPDYRMLDNAGTSPDILLRAAKIGERAGLNFIYAGNLPGLIDKYEDTRCPKCQHTLVQRYGFSLKNYMITPTGCCPKCGEKIPGIWESPPIRSFDYPLSVF